MLNNFFKINFLPFLLIGILLLTTTTYASEYLIQPNSKSEEDIIAFLNDEEHKPFLINLNKEIFLRDKDKPYIANKMCTHGEDVIEAWKKFTLPKPDSFPFNSHQWKNMLARKGLFTFNPHLQETVQVKIEKQLATPDSITARKASGEGATAIIIEARWNEDDIGILTEDNSPTIPGPTKRNKGNASSPESQNYVTTIINRVEAEYDITDIIQNIKTNGLKSLDNYAIGNLGSIKTICPSLN